MYEQATSSTSSIHDVVIAGAGPVGLFLASELRLAGLSVLLLEAAADPHTPLKRLPFGLRGLWGPSLEAFHRRGLLERVAAGVPQHSPGPTPSGPARRGPAGHFGGIQFDHANIDSSRWTYRIPGPADAHLGVEMEHLETVLAAHALESGAEIRRGVSVDGFDATADGVTVHAGGEQIRARYLVGCDGGRSAVRKLGGFSFVGTDPELTGYSFEATLADPAMLPLGRHYTAAGMYTQWQGGAIVMADFDGGAFHRTQPITKEHVQSVLRRISGTEVTLSELRMATTWTDRSQQATTYRNGRVLLAGDSAHIHSPLGGQGLNLGIGDAMNLGWKLALVLRGSSPESLLETYTSERHPIGARVLEWTRAQVASMRPDRGSRALQAVLRDLIGTRDGATYFAERVWGATLQYDLGGTHPVVGRSCPDFELADGTRVGAHLRDGRALLVDLTNDGSLASLELGATVRHVAGPAKDSLGLRALLVRPDGFVAWATDDAPDTADLTRAARRWFGPQC